MATAKQIAARKLFAERAKAGEFAGRKTRAKNPLTRVKVHQEKNPSRKVKYNDTAKELRGDARVGYSVHSADHPGYHAIGWFTKKADAIAVAQEAADRTGKKLAVSRVQIYFGAE